MVHGLLLCQTRVPAAAYHGCSDTHRLTCSGTCSSRQSLVLVGRPHWTPLSSFGPSTSLVSAVSLYHLGVSDFIPFFFFRPAKNYQINASKPGGQAICRQNSLYMNYLFMKWPDHTSCFGYMCILAQHECKLLLIPFSARMEKRMFSDGCLAPHPKHYSTPEAAFDTAHYLVRLVEPAQAAMTEGR